MNQSEPSLNQSISFSDIVNLPTVSEKIAKHNIKKKHSIILISASMKEVMEEKKKEKDKKCKVKEQKTKKKTKNRRLRIK